MFCYFQYHYSTCLSSEQTMHPKFLENLEILTNLTNFGLELIILMQIYILIIDMLTISLWPEGQNWTWKKDYQKLLSEQGIRTSHLKEKIWNKQKRAGDITYLPPCKRKVQNKKEEKNLTSVSFAFTHTYTTVKTNSFRFFSPSVHGKFWKMCKNGQHGHTGRGWGC